MEETLFKSKLVELHPSLVARWLSKGIRSIEKGDASQNCAEKPLP